MQDRAEIVWNTYAKLRSDVLLGDRCSAICNETLLAFVTSLTAAMPTLGFAPADNPDAGRYFGDEALVDADRAMERVVTALV